jgi:hypothetical protein
LGLKTPPGFDPIIGQTNQVNIGRNMTGYDAKDLDKSVSMPTFVKTEGGEYFFMPSLDCLKNVFATA